MQKLDDAWNARDWDTFDAYHDAESVVVYWPGQEDNPTHGGHDHRAEAQRFCAAFPDNRVHNQPYAVVFGEGDYTCFVTRFTGTFTAPLELPDGNTIQPTGKAFDLRDFRLAGGGGCEIGRGCSRRNPNAGHSGRQHSLRESAAPTGSLRGFLYGIRAG
jgi:hypothetical protein